MVKLFRAFCISFYIMAFIFFIGGASSFFYKEINADSVDTKEFHIMRGGYGSSSSGETGRFSFLFLSYSYKIHSSVLEGYWLKIGLNYKNKYDNKVFYNPLVPIISVKEKGISIFWVSFLLLFGFICSQASKFFAYLNKHT